MKLFPLLPMLLHGFMAAAEVPAPLVNDRGAVERIYHDHRLGTKQPFEQAMPLSLIEQLVRSDLRKEFVLKRIYDVEVSPAMVEAEIRRIDATSRAPEVLAEIKRALGDDPARFARSVARPAVVERTLRQRFDNDEALHSSQRATAEQGRRQLLAKEAVADMQECTWLFAPRRAAEIATSTPVPEAQPTTSSSGSYSNEATARVGEPLGGGTGEPGKLDHHFEDLDPALQNVLRIQLREPGSVSAVIETPAAFLIFRAKEVSAAALTAACLTVSKRSYDEWLAEQPMPPPP